MDLLSGCGQSSLSHACHGSGNCSIGASNWMSGAAGLGLQSLIGLSLSLLLEMTGAGSIKYSIDKYWWVWLVGHVIGISGMVVTNEDGMTGMDGWMVV